MFVEVGYPLRRCRGQIIGWELDLSLCRLLMVSRYSDIKEIDYTVFLEYYSQEIMVFLEILPVWIN
jgi:hypothetical protein